MSDANQKLLKKLKKYKYQLDVNVIFPDEKTPYKLGKENIINFFIENDYDLNFFPIVKISIGNDAAFKHKLSVHRKKVKFRINLKKFTVKDDSTYIDNEIYPETIIDGLIFQPFIVNVDHEHGRVFEKTTEEETDSKKHPVLNEIVELFLFPLQHLDINKTIINTIIVNSDILGAVGYVVNKSGMKNVLIDLPDRTEKFEQIIIPPLNVRNSFEYLQRTYGIYKYGLRVFMDFLTTYIMGKSLDKVPVKNGEYENVIINVGDISKLANRMELEKEFQEGCYKDTENKVYIINNLNLFNVTSSSVLTKEVEGNIFRFYSTKRIKGNTKFDADSSAWTIGTGYKEIKSDVDGFENNDKIRYIYNHLNNDYLEDEFISSINKDDITLLIPFEDIDIEILSPNRRYKFNFLENIWKSYNDTYRLTKIVFGIESLSKDQSMTFSGVCEFKKAEI